MATKTIYVNPGDMVHIKVIKDPEVPRTNVEWRNQNRPPSILMRVSSVDTLDFSDPPILRKINFSGEVKKYLQ